MPNGRDGEIGTGRSPKARWRIAPTRHQSQISKQQGLKPNNETNNQKRT